MVKNNDMDFIKKIAHPNGYALFIIYEDEISLDYLKAYRPRQGTGRQLIDELKKVAIKLDLPISLYAEPQDSSIDEEGLKAFYKSCGFVQHPDGVDNEYIWYPSPEAKIKHEKYISKYISNMTI